MIALVQAVEGNNERGIKLSVIGFNMMGALMVSNPWTVILEGNIDLSIMINAITNLFGYGEQFLFSEVQFFYFIHTFILLSALTSLYVCFLAELFHKNIYQPFHEYEQNLYFFCIPICIGIIMKLITYKIFPRAIDIAMEFLKWLSPVAVLVFLVKWLEFDLDLFVYRLFTWEVRYFYKSNIIILWDRHRNNSIQIII